MLRFRQLAAAVLLVMVAMPAAVSPGQQAAEQLEGIVKAVDVDKSTLVITLTRDKDEKDQTFNLAKEVAVSINKKAGKLAELKSGMRVRLALSDNKQAVVAIDEQPLRTQAEYRDCPRCGKGCGFELSREWCESFALYKGHRLCWCEIADFVICNPGGFDNESRKIAQRDWADTMDKAYALAKEKNKLVLHVGNTGG